MSVGAADEFMQLMIAAMADAATSGNLTQLSTQIEINGKAKLVRIIVVPEVMALVRTAAGKFEPTS